MTGGLASTGGRTTGMFVRYHVWSLEFGTKKQERIFVQQKLGGLTELSTMFDEDIDDWHVKSINLARANGHKEREIRELKARLHVVEAERDALIMRPYDG